MQLGHQNIPLRFTSCFFLLLFPVSPSDSDLWVRTSRQSSYSETRLEGTPKGNEKEYIKVCSIQSAMFGIGKANVITECTCLLSFTGYLSYSAWTCCTRSFHLCWESFQINCSEWRTWLPLVRVTREPSEMITQYVNASVWAASAVSRPHRLPVVTGHRAAPWTAMHICLPFTGQLLKTPTVRLCVWLVIRRRRSGQSVTASDFGSNGPRFESDRGRCVESLDKALYSLCPKEKPSH